MAALTALAIGAGIAGATALGGGYIASQAAKKAGQIGAKGAKKGAAAQVAGLEQGVSESGALYDESQNYLAPYAQNQDPYNFLAGGYGTPEQQGASLETYQGSPNYNLLQQAQEDAVRRSQGSAAAGGMLKSGAQIESLGRRLSDMSLADYYKYQETAKGLTNVGFGASQSASNLAQNRGNQLMGAYGNIGTAQASGIVGKANALSGAATQSGQAWQGALQGVGNAATFYAGGGNDYFGLNQGTS